MRFYVFVSMAVSCLLAVPSASSAEDASAGRKLYRQKCAACHATHPRRGVGPHFAELFGRKAGAVSDYRYSPGLKEAGEKGLVWSTENVGEFLAGPDKFVQSWTSDRTRHPVTCRKNGERQPISKDLSVVMDCDVPLSAQNMQDLSAYLADQ